MKRIDCRGLQCPQPVVETRAAIQSGSTSLEVLVDNPTSLENVTRFLSKNGFSTNTSEKAGVWSITAERSGAAPAAEKAQPRDAGQSAGPGKTLVLITTPTIGRGDEQLGAKLMKNFLATLPEIRSLWRIVLLNGGVRLAAEPGEILAELEKLAAAGVSVLVCGTCLAHYGLTDQKKVGETSNMLDIVTSLDLADKIIRP